MSTPLLQKSFLAPFLDRRGSINDRLTVSEPAASTKQFLKAEKPSYL
jgi:hypothetical protein